MENNSFSLLPTVLLGIVLTATPLHAQDGDEKSRVSGEIAPAVRYIGVDGDDEKFREDWWMQEDWTGGIEQFSLDGVLGDDIFYHAEGRAILPEEDYELLLEIEKGASWFIRAGYTEYRKYSDGTGGFFEPFSIPVFELDRDLHLDIGNLFLEVGLDRPGRPRIVLGYEHGFRDGEKSLLEWGSVTEGGTNRKIFPSYKEIDEKLDIFKAEIEHDIGRVNLSNQFRYEHYDIGTTRYESELNLDTNASESVTIMQDYKHDAFYNTFHADSHISEKLYLSLGYFFTTLDGEASLRMRTVPFGPEPFDRNWSTISVEVSQDTHIVSTNAMLGPFKDLTFYGGIQGESLDTTGDTNAVLTQTLPGVGVASPNALIVSDKDKWGLEETFGVRYVGIPRTTLYAEGKWIQQDIDLFERELEDGEIALLRDTDSWVNRQRYSIGFNTSPIPRVTFSGRYRRSYRSNDYDHLTDNNPDEYPAFITDQDFTIDEFSTKLSLRPASWLQTSLQYQLLSMKIDTSTLTEPPSTVQSGDVNANIYNLSVTLTPLARFYITGLFSYQDISSHSFDNSSPSVQTYDGDVFTAIGSATYAIDQKTKAAVQYLYSFSDNFKDNSESGLPLGLDNRRHGLITTLSRRLSNNIEAKLNYGFYQYDEDSNGGVDNYDAHLVSLGCSFRF
jgi:hypothetical protein